MDDIKPPQNRGSAMDIRPRTTPQPVQRGAATPVSRPNVTPPAGLPAAQANTALQPTALTPENKPVAFSKMKLPPKTKAPIAAIVTAIIVAAGLIGLTVFAYLKTQDDTKSSGDTSSTQQQSSSATPEDITASEEAIDSELSTIDDTTDFNTEDLSDSALGL